MRAVLNGTRGRVVTIGLVWDRLGHLRVAVWVMGGVLCRLRRLRGMLPLMLLRRRLIRVRLILMLSWGSGVSGVLGAV